MGADSTLDCGSDRIYLLVSLSIYKSVCLTGYIDKKSVHQFTCLFICFSVSESVSEENSQFVYLTNCMSRYLAVCSLPLFSQSEKRLNLISQPFSTNQKQALKRHRYFLPVAIKPLPDIISCQPITTKHFPDITTFLSQSQTSIYINIHNFSTNHKRAFTCHKTFLNQSQTSLY